MLSEHVFRHCTRSLRPAATKFDIERADLLDMWAVRAVENYAPSVFMDVLQLSWLLAGGVKESGYDNATGDL